MVFNGNFDSLPYRQKSNVLPKGQKKTRRKPKYLRTNSETTFVKSSVSLVKKFPLWSSAVWNGINSQNLNQPTVTTVKFINEQLKKKYGKVERFSTVWKVIQKWFGFALFHSVSVIGLNKGSKWFVDTGISFSKFLYK